MSKVDLEKQKLKDYFWERDRYDYYRKAKIKLNRGFWTNFFLAGDDLEAWDLAGRLFNKWFEGEYKK